MDGRREKGSGGVSQRADGMWVASVELPTDIYGKRRRKKIARKRKVDAIAALREMRRELERAGDLATSSPTMDQWLTYWLGEVSAKRVRPKTQSEREGDVRRYITPAIGNIRIDKLTPSHVRQAHALAMDDGRSSTTALRVHRLLSVSLRDAMREGKVTRNVATSDYMDAPSAAIHQARTLTVDESLNLLRVAMEQTQGARWTYGLLTGARVGEVLGLEWSQVDWQAGTVTMAWQLQRIIWSHGCGGECGFSRISHCPQRIQKSAPAGHEERQIPGWDTLQLVRPKTRAGWRVVPLVEPLTGLLLALWDRQGQPTTGLVFSGDHGAPISPEADYESWQRITKAAGVEGMRRHDARHTAATLLLGLGVDQEVVRQLLGHSSVAVTSRYQHADVTLVRDGLTKLGAALTPVVVSLLQQ